MRIERGGRVVDDVRDFGNGVISGSGEYIGGRTRCKDFFVYFFKDFI